MNPPSQTTSSPSSDPTERSPGQIGEAPPGGADSQAPLASSLRPRGPAQLELIERDQGAEIHLLAQGELDLLTAPKLAAALVRILHTGDADVVVDLGDTLFIDSAGLHVLLNAQRRLTRRSRKLRVICGAGPVRQVIEMARLLDALNVSPE